MAENRRLVRIDWQPLATGSLPRGENGDITPTALCQAVGIKQSTLRGWEDDLRTRSSTAWRRSRAFGVSMNVADQWRG